MTVEEASALIAERAKKLLFHANGKPKGEAHFLRLLTLQSILRRATTAEQIKPGLGQSLFEWNGEPWLYDKGIMLIFLSDAKNGDAAADSVLCNAAAVLLNETGQIPDLELRSYVVSRLSGELKPNKKRARGRSVADNSLRDLVIVSRLFPPLLSHFDATRNVASKKPCVSSIVSEALGRLHINVGERRIAELWTKHSPRLAVANK